MRAVILAIDTQIYQGLKEDVNSPVVRRMLEKVGFSIEMVKSIPRDQTVVEHILSRLVDEDTADFIITIGGVGCYSEDTVPEATKEILDREIPGIPDAMRAYCMRTERKYVLMRGVAGIRKHTLILNLPESPKSNTECLEYAMPELVLAVETLLGQHEEGRE